MGVKTKKARFMIKISDFFYFQSYFLYIYVICGYIMIINLNSNAIISHRKCISLDYNGKIVNQRVIYEKKLRIFKKNIFFVFQILFKIFIRNMRT